jgi:hypothetical protein
MERPKSKTSFQKGCNLKATSYQVFHSFYEEIEHSPPPIFPTTRNLFLTLAETIAQSLNIFSCYVLGGGETNMGNRWPWEAKELDPRKPPNGTGCPHLKAGTWLLKTSIIGKNCLAQWGGQPPLEA